MKKLFAIIALLFVLTFVFTSCKINDQTDGGEDNGNVDSGDNNKTDDVNPEPDQPVECQHSWTIVTTEPKCTEGGITLKVCSICGVGVSENETNPLGHSYNNQCDENYHWRQCTRCDRIIDRLAHDFGGGSVCGKCGYMGSEVVYSEGLEFALSLDGSYYILIGLGTCTDSHIVIPREYNSLPVKEIDTYAFMPDDDDVIYQKFYEYSASIAEGYPIEPDASLTRVKSVTFFENITSVGENYPAFTFLLGLENINVIDNSYYEFEDGVLYSAGKKDIISYLHTKTDESFVIPSSVENVGNGAFILAINLKNIVFSHSVTRIGEEAFGFCASLTDVVIPDNTTDICLGAFYYCTSLSSVVIGNGVTSIGRMAFYYCNSLSSIVIPNSVTSIDHMTFSDCDSLTSIVIPDSVTNIGDSAFSGCSSLTSIVIPDSVTNIGDSAFSGCSSLSSIVIPDGVTSIGREAFYYCSSLSSIVIPDSVTSIDTGAFDECNSLTDVYYSGSQSEWESISIESSNELLENANIHFAEEDNPYSEGLAFTSNGDGTCYVSGIGSCRDTEIVIPPTSPDGYAVTGIGEDAFNDCNLITSVVIPDGVTYIGAYAFTFCYALSNVVIPDSVIDIQDHAFSSCTSLESIDLPNSVITIGYAALSECSALESLVIPDSVTSIGDMFALNCTSLKSVIIGSGLSSLGDGAFLDCHSIVSISVAEENQKYKDIDGNLYSKDGKTLLKYAIAKTDTSFVVPDGVYRISAFAFWNNKNLTSITISDDVFYIGSYAFYSCSNLTYITIPKSVTSISNNAFDSCTSLVAVQYMGSQSEWNNISIDSGNDSLTNANIHYNYN